MEGETVYKNILSKTQNALTAILNKQLISI